ncbi:hypothetical protein NDU88_007037 [Pleurodeles waltl]|uniref:Uncharacterized protein n=1 Tax=Pleurodeles waltl TaxID=8319 RepID=A0AAV7RPR0_PLEWA|nr:hypothetical protein NDU88_007037 [Pleurodeles waltl]
MPRGKSSRDSSVSLLWSKFSPVAMTNKGESSAQPITQEYMDKFLSDIKLEMVSLKADFKSCMQDLRRELTEVGTKVDDIERNTDARTEDHEMLWQRKAALEDQHIKLQAKQENEENHSSRHNIYM